MKTWVFIRHTLLLSAAVALVAGGLSYRTTRTAHAAPDDVVQDFVAAINDGDAAAAAALFTGDGIFTDINGGSFAGVGTAALTSIFEDAERIHLSIELTNVTVDGEEVTGTARISDDDSDAAGVTRYLQPFTAIVQNDKITELHLTYSEVDGQTQTYLDYRASQEEDDGGLPPGAVELTLGPGRDGSQPGTAFIFEDPEAPGVTFVGIQIAPGATGVLQPAHIHDGDCPGVGAIASPLASVLDGFSFTLVSMTQAELLAGNFAINVHKSATEIGVYVACGEVAAASVAPTPTAGPAATPTRATGVTAPDTGAGPAGGDASGGAWLLGAVVLAAMVAAGGALTLKRDR